MVLTLNFVFYFGVLLNPRMPKLSHRLSSHARKGGLCESLTSLETRELSIKLSLTVKPGTYIVWPEVQLVDTYRKELDNLKASLNW